MVFVVLRTCLFAIGYILGYIGLLGAELASRVWSNPHTRQSRVRVVENAMSIYRPMRLGIRKRVWI